MYKIKNVLKRGVPPVLGDFWPFWVKIGAKAVYYSGSHWMQAIEENLSVHLRGELRSSRGCILIREAQLMENTPSDDLWARPWGALRDFLQWLAFNGSHCNTLLLHRFWLKGQKSPKTGCTPLFSTFFILYIYNFFPGAGRGPKMVFF